MGIPIALFGDTGMVGQEIERILKGHDLVEIRYRQNSKREEGNLDECVLAFLATKDPESMQFAPKLLEKGKRVIDMSGAFRLSREEYEKWYNREHLCPNLLDKAVYGLPAFFHDNIKNATLVANPGCYVTSVVLAVRPIHDLIEDTISIDAVSGISGAGLPAKEIPNLRTYKAGRQHQHLPEIERYAEVNVRKFSPSVDESVFRGILSCIDARLRPDFAGLNPNEAKAILMGKIQSAYSPKDLVYVVDGNEKRTWDSWGTADVNNTHRCIIKLLVYDGNVLVYSMIDNLGKGAASQAVENMNIMLKFKERLYGIGHAYSIEPPVVNLSK